MAAMIERGQLRARASLAYLYIYAAARGTIDMLFEFLRAHMCGSRDGCVDARYVSPLAADGARVFRSTAQFCIRDIDVILANGRSQIMRGPGVIY